MDQTVILGGVVVFLLAARYVVRVWMLNKAVAGRVEDIRAAWEWAGVTAPREREEAAVSFLLSELARARTKQEGTEQVRVIKLLPDDILDRETREELVRNLEYVPVFNEFLALYNIRTAIPPEFVVECIADAREGTVRLGGDVRAERKMIMSRLRRAAANVAYILDPDESVEVHDDELAERMRRYGMIG